MYGLRTNTHTHTVPKKYVVKIKKHQIDEFK